VPDVRLQARDLVTGWILSLWALGLGAYLTSGGAKQLTSPAYSILMRAIQGHYEWVGVVLVAFGVASVIAMLSGRPRPIAATSLACGLWCAAISFYMGVALCTVDGAGNVNTFTSGALALLFFVRALDYTTPRVAA
jgi:uncharacterized membrane protein